MNIVVLDGHVNNPGDLSWDALKQYGELRVYDRTSREELAERLAHVEVAISNKLFWNEQALEAAPNLKLIALTSTGYNVVDLQAAKKRGVLVANVPSYSTPDVAQMVFALLLELCVHAGKYSRLVMDGAWVRAKDFTFFSTPLVELCGKKIGIVGMGSIGQAVCRIAQAFGMSVMFTSHHPKPELECEGVSQVVQADLFAQCDVITLHVPLTPETEQLINEQSIASMKDGSFLLNTARGALVDEHAVLRALRSEKLAGFGADVVSKEPMRSDNPLLQAKDLNVVLTPHIAWATHEARARLLKEVSANIGAFVKGQPRNIVNG